MRTIKHLKKLVLDGMLVQSVVDKYTTEGTLRKNTGIQKPSISLEEFSFSPKITATANKMSEVYIAFYCFENLVRDLIIDRLSERHGNEWWKNCVPEKVKLRVEDLKSKESKNKYLSPRASTNIGYTMLGDLASIIITRWDDFSDILPNQAWVTSRLNDLEMSRNIIMHSGILPDDEIDRIKTSLRDWVEQVG